jgi:hypothetical protein
MGYMVGSSVADPVVWDRIAMGAMWWGNPGLCKKTLLVNTRVVSAGI